MLGLGAGIDYALLIIGRYREQVAAGDSRRDASAKSAATSGASVVAAGLIVMLAIAGLLVIGIPFIGKLGIGAAIAVGAVVVSALTILPIMIGAFGRWLTPKKPEHVRPSPGFERWGELVTERPWLSIAAGVLAAADLRRAGHAAAARPARRRQPARGQAPARRLRPAERGVRHGLQRPVPASPSTSRRAAPTNQADLDKLQKAIAGTDGVAQAAPAQPSEDGKMATIFAIPTTAPQDKATSELLDRLREETIPRRHRGHAARGQGLHRRRHAGLRGPLGQGRLAPAAVHLGRDRAERAAADHGLPVALGPARVGAVFNLLSVLAAYGVVVAVFQEGIGASLLGVDSRRPDRVLHPGHAVRDPVRAEHGLQRLPAQPHPRGLQRGRPAARVRDPRHGADRQGDPVRRPDHVRRVPGLRDPARRDRRR